MTHQYMRKQAITSLELTKGFTSEQRTNAVNTIEELASYILELTTPKIQWRKAHKSFQCPMGLNSYLVRNINEPGRIDNIVVNHMVLKGEYYIVRDDLKLLSIEADY